MQLLPSCGCCTIQRCLPPISPVPVRRKIKIHGVFFLFPVAALCRGSDAMRPTQGFPAHYKAPQLPCLNGQYHCHLVCTYVLYWVWCEIIFRRLCLAFDRLDLDAPTLMCNCVAISSCVIPSIANRLKTVLYT